MNWVSFTDEFNEMLNQIEIKDQKLRNVNKELQEKNKCPNEETGGRG
jgi:hypothetical protein